VRQRCDAGGVIDNEHYPRRSGSIKGGVTTVKNETGPAWIYVVFYYVTAVICEGLLSFTFVLYLLILSLKSVNVPPPPSHNNELCYTELLHSQTA